MIPIIRIKYLQRMCGHFATAKMLKNAGYGFDEVLFILTRVIERRKK